MTSFVINCLILGDNIDNIVSVPITTENNVMELKSLIHAQAQNRFVNYDAKDLNLWEVDIPYEVNEKTKLLNTVPPFEINIEQQFGGVKLSAIQCFSKIPIKGHIHIIVEAIGTHERILDKILKGVEFDVFDVEPKKMMALYMPLKERNTYGALEIITNNINRTLFPITSKADFNFLFCGGAAGIGKTRLGFELFQSLKNDWSPPVHWTRNNTKPHFLYLLLDFSNGVHLDTFDQNLDASIIIGLRIAYKYFAHHKMAFDFFKYTVRSLNKSLDAFNVTLVLNRIRTSLNLQPEQQLVIFLHIDGYQEIFDFEENWKVASKKGLFKELMYVTGSLMTEASTAYYVQTFLSGTAPRDIIKSEEPNSYSFSFVECPLLSTAAILEIVDYYAKENGDKQRGWMISASFLQILYDTGGLPRALQSVLEIFLVTKNFFDQLKEGKFSFFDNMFNAVVQSLIQKYNIRDFARRNIKTCRLLLYHCFCGIPVKLNQILDANSPQLTVEKLERDGYLILKRLNESDYLVQMPFYFVFIYNLELNIAPNIFHAKLQPNPDMNWEEWERFVAQFEVFYNNLLFDVGIREISLREYYKGAIGKNSVLDTQIKLQKLSGICETSNHFPKTGQPKRKSDNMLMSFESEHVFINGKSAPFADAFLARSNSQKIIMAFQQKWYSGFGFITIEDIKKECKKNKDAVNTAKQQKITGLNDYRVITIIFTSQRFKEEDVDDLPDDCLVIANENFEQCFGPVFSSRLAFAMLCKFNLNFAKLEQIVNVFEGIGDIGSDIASQICNKRPYYDVDDLVDKNKNYSSVKKVKKELMECSYIPYSYFTKPI